VAAVAAWVVWAAAVVHPHPVAAHPHPRQLQQQPVVHPHPHLRQRRQHQRLHQHLVVRVAVAAAVAVDVVVVGKVRCSFNNKATLVIKRALLRQCPFCLCCLFSNLRTTFTG
jgi:hypothetical protein